MTLTLPAEWLEAFSTTPINHRHIVTINIGRRGFFNVVDYSLASGVVLTIDVGGAGETITEGVEWTAETDNDTTAANIAGAITRYIAGANAWSKDDNVTVVITGGVSLAMASDDATAVAATPAVDTTDSVSFVTGDSVLFDYSPSIASVRPAAEEIDAVKRVYTAGAKIVTFEDDGAIRRLFTQYEDIKGKLVDVKLGSSDIAENKFINDGKYVVDEIEPMPGRIVMRLADAGAILDDQEILMNVVSLHPLEVILAVLEAAGVPSALYDASTLDPTDFSDIGHWCVSRHPWWTEVGINPSNAISSPMNAADIVNELLELLDGTFAPDENGQFKFTRYDPAGAAVASWDEDNSRDFRQPDTWQKLKNYITVKGSPRNGRPMHLWSRGDGNSEGRYATAGGERYRKNETFNSDWLNALGFMKLGTTITVAAGQVLSIQRAVTHGFSGCKFPAVPPSQAQDTNTDCTAARPVYLMIFDESNNYEIVKVETITVPTVSSSELIDTVHNIHSSQFDRRDDIVDAWTGRPHGRGGSRFTLPGQRYWFVLEFTLTERAVSGTARAWDASGTAASGQPHVVDVTIAKDIADRKLIRLAHGITPVEIMTDFREMAVQLGELVTILNDQYLNHGKDGSDDTSVLFEVLRKEPRPHADRPGIAWKLRKARHTWATPFLEFVPPQQYFDLVTSIAERTYVLDNDGNYVQDNDGNYVTITV